MKLFKSVLVSWRVAKVSQLLHLYSLVNIFRFNPVYGKGVKTVAVSPFTEEDDTPNGQQTVTYEARAMKALLLKLQTY